MKEIHTQSAANHWRIRPIPMGASRPSVDYHYHRFSEREGGARISARAFAEQAQYLAAHYTLVPLSQRRTVCEGERFRRVWRRSRLTTVIATLTRSPSRFCADIARPPRFRRDRICNGTTWLWTDKPRYLTALAAPQAFEIGIGDHKLRLELNGGASRAVAAGLINAALPLSGRSQGRLNRATGLKLAKGETA